MGSDFGRADETPQHQVFVDEYWIDLFEVTNAQYLRYLQKTGRPSPPYYSNSTYPVGQADFPVVGVRWLDADAYCRMFDKRLPTEAEWEKACRGLNGSIFPWGNVWDASNTNVNITAGEHSRAMLIDSHTAWKEMIDLVELTPTGPEFPGLRSVGSYPGGISPFGVYDMAGNASEWVMDWYNWSNYDSLSNVNPLSTGPEYDHSMRGSPWYDPVSTGMWVIFKSRCSMRNSDHWSNDLRSGFRCARSSHESNIP